jgi:hypothetical protein
VRGEDHFHVGIVVDDVEATLARLTDLFGYEWAPEMGGTVPVRLPDGDTELAFRCIYSRTSPRIEIVPSMPGTVWVPAEGSGIHHLGYWSDDLGADSAALADAGFAFEAGGLQPDGTRLWAYHRSPVGPRIELVSRVLQPMMEQLWT